MDGFELFEGQRGRRRTATGPSASLSKSGMLTLNEFAVSLFGKKVPESVQLFFNPKTNTIAIKPASPEDDYTYKLKPDKSGARSTITARSFASHYNIDLSKRHVVEPDKLEDMVIIPLGEDAVVGKEVREPVEA